MCGKLAVIDLGMLVVLLTMRFLPQNAGCASFQLSTIIQHNLHHSGNPMIPIPIIKWHVLCIFFLSVESTQLYMPVGGFVSSH
jgi:hypothetical protein